MNDVELFNRILFLLDFQGLNYFPPVPLFQGDFPTYLTDKYRVPGLRKPKSKSGEEEVNDADDDEKTILDDLKVSLITFGVSGSSGSLTSNPLLKLTESSADHGDSSDDDPDEVNSSKRRRVDYSSEKTVVLKSGTLSYEFKDKGK